MSNYKKCPTCLGTGKIIRQLNRRNYTPEVRAEARRLYRKGFTLRVIGEKLGIDHPQKVLSMIKSSL